MFSLFSRCRSASIYLVCLKWFGSICACRIAVCGCLHGQPSPQRQHHSSKRCLAVLRPLRQALVAHDAEMQKIVSFTNAFDSLFRIIADEGGVAGSIVVEDSLAVIAHLVRNDVSQRSFREMGSVPSVPMVPRSTLLVVCPVRGYECAARHWADSAKQARTISLPEPGIPVSSGIFRYIF